MLRSTSRSVYETSDTSSFLFPRPYATSPKRICSVPGPGSVCPQLSTGRQTLSHANKMSSYENSLCDGCNASASCEFIGRNGIPYPLCDRCYVDIQEAMNATEPVYNTCATCLSADATHKYRSDDGTVLEVCEGCFLLDLYDTPICDGCDEKFATRNCDEQNLCEDCYDECDTCLCEDCSEREATQYFVHLDGRSFDLCDGCWALADHADDYGADFGSAPRLRKNGPAFFCTCMSPVSLCGAPRCATCSGILVHPPRDLNPAAQTPLSH